jgi:tetratricopeptide (TPR) repeat protein
MKKLILLGLIFLFIGCPPTEKNSVKIYIGQGEFEKAKEQALKGLMDYPGDYELYCLLGKAEIGMANWTAASKAFQDAFKVDSANTIKWVRSDKENISVFWQTFYNAAYALSGEKKFKEALTNLKFAKLIDPDDVSQYILEGAIYGELGDSEAANNAYAQALSIDPENPEAYYLIGKALFESELYDSSMIYFNDAIKHFQVKLNRIEKVIFQNVPEPSTDLKNEIVKLWKDKKNEDLDQLVKVKLGFDGGLNAQKRNIETFFKTTDGMAQSYYLLGMAYYKIEKYATALEYLYKGLELMPFDSKILFFTGEVLVRTGKYEEAISYFEKVIQMNEEDYFAWFYIGASHLQLKRYEKAIEIYEDKVLQIKPDFVGAMINLASAYQSIGNSKKAYEWLVKAEELQKEQ